METDRREWLIQGREHRRQRMSYLEMETDRRQRMAYSGKRRDNRQRMSYPEMETDRRQRMAYSGKGTQETERQRMSSSREEMDWIHSLT